MGKDQKLIERNIIEEVRKLSSEFPDGELIDCDPPDFYIKDQDKIIGFEVTEYIRGQSKVDLTDKKFEVDYQRLVSGAQQLFEIRNNVHLLVCVGFKKEVKFSREEMEQSKEELSTAIETLLSNHTENPIFIEDKELISYDIQNFCRSLSVFRQKEKFEWRLSSSGWITLDKTEIQFLIDKKAEKIPIYKVNCDQKWLIINSSGKNMSATLDPEYILDVKFTSPFDKVVLLDQKNKFLHTLHLIPGS